MHEKLHANFFFYFFFSIYIILRLLLFSRLKNQRIIEYNKKIRWNKEKKKKTKHNWVKE